MPSIGPQLPSQPSAKRKRTSEPGDASPSSSSKHARHNGNEIALDDSDSDDYGPRAAPPTAPSLPSLGPSLPPSASVANKDEISLLDDSDSDTGPAPPPSAAAGGGPAPPSSDSGSDSDDEYGPALPNASSRRAPIGPSMPPTTDDPSAPTRDAWMLAPPTSTGYTERDPTKLRARTFTSKPGASSSGDSSLAAIWTETPEEKLKRLQDAVLGRSSDNSSGSKAADARARDEEARNKKISASITATRGKSLYDEHQGGAKRAGKEEEDDPSKRAFDREKDMALGSKIGSAQRREFVAKSANFGGRFQKGSFL